MFLQRLQDAFGRISDNLQPVRLCMKSEMKKMIILLFILCTTTSAIGATRYVDATAGACSGNYSIANRNCTGSDGTSYATVQAAASAVSIGDVIKIRGGTYTESILLPNVNGTAWTTGNYITMESYDGEWAIIQCPLATNIGIYRKNGSSQAPPDVPTAYWKFERLEIKSCGIGMLFDAGPIWIRYCYIHDNIYSGSCDDNISGVWINQARQCVIEYSWFKDNDATSSSANCSNIGFDSDYYDDYNPTYFDPDDATSRNEVRYNLLEGSQSSLTHKNQQRFGTNTRTATGVSSGSYKEWGDKWHHNIVKDYGTNGIKPDQDNAQVYNNIVVESSLGSSAIAIQFGREEWLSSHQPILYNPVIFNNTIIKSNKGIGYFAGGDAVTSWHGYGWFYNNIIDQNDATDWQFFPFVIAADMESGYYATMTDMFIKNNLIHSPSWQSGFSPYVFLRGRADYYTLTNAQSAFASVSNNWQNTTSSLYSSGYVTNGSFIVTGSTTIANGGIGGSHPYRTDMGNIPSYVGAVNPSDSNWVAGVLGLASTTVLRAGTSNNPSWIEGETPSTYNTSVGTTFKGVTIR
jgi:hypothetical protein